MIKYESECVGCPPSVGGCAGRSCPYYEVEILICDSCGDETDKLYKYEDAELCEECLLKNFEVISDE